MKGGQSSRARPLVFLSAQRRLGEKDGPYVCVASIEMLEPGVGDDLPHNVEDRMEECPSIPMQNSSFNSGVASFKCGTQTNKRKACLWPPSASESTFQADTVNTRDMCVDSGKLNSSTRERDFLFN